MVAAQAWARIVAGGSAARPVRGAAVVEGELELDDPQAAKLRLIAMTLATAATRWRTLSRLL
jgi:hypothetical protein